MVPVGGCTSLETKSYYMQYPLDATPSIDILSLIDGLRTLRRTIFPPNLLKIRPQRV